MDKLINFPVPRTFHGYASQRTEPQPVSRKIESTEASSDPLLCKVELPLHAVFYPLGFPFEIITNNQAILDAAGASWGHTKQRDDGPVLQFRIGVTTGTSGNCPPGPVVRCQQHLLSIVADAHNQAICDLQAGSAFAWLTEDALLHPSYARYHFIEAVALILISTSYTTPLHAACVSRHGRGMLLCGESGTGKSTLAYACARSGWIFTSDDASYLKHHASELRVAGNSHQFRFRPSAKNLFPELEGRNITPRAEGKPSIEVPSAELLGIATADQALIHDIILLNRMPTAQAELRTLPREAAAQYFQQFLHLPGDVHELHLEALRTLSAAAVYELRYQDLQQAVECLDLLARDPNKFL
jgi:hypothetical protein